MFFLYLTHEDNFECWMLRNYLLVREKRLEVQTIELKGLKENQKMPFTRKQSTRDGHILKT